ncbi:MAG TPA: cobalt ECF transporter T component CbiQ [Acidimicrobiia bacterium]|nr:cobalt ECF transporter T component CbiQ [Acidimicrobiia bacterium]
MSGVHGHALHYHGHSPVHRAAAEVKLVVLLVFVISVVATPAQAVWVFSGYVLILMVLLAISAVPPGFFLRRLAIDIPFVLFALLIPWLGAEPKVAVGPFTLSEPGLWGAWNILAKATLGAGASILLVATTEVPHLLAGLGRLRVPAIITSIASFMIRYLEVIAGELRRTRIAMSARGYRPTRLSDAKPLGLAAGALFIRSYERGERVHQAMLARGFTGSMPDLDEPASPRWWPGLWPAAAAVALAVVGRVIS